jgi:hypothetical protein
MKQTVYSQWHRILRCILGLGLALGSHFLHADILDLPSAQPATSNIQMPVRGQTMDEVLEQFGEPKNISQPIGNPPITRWTYPTYSVVFEREYVIDSVPKRDLPGTD